MKVTLLKDWGKTGYKKGDTPDIKDKSVLKKGMKEGLFKNEKIAGEKEEPAKEE